MIVCKCVSLQQQKIIYMKKVTKKTICPLLDAEAEYLKRGEYRIARVYTEKILRLTDYNYLWYAD